MIIYFLLQFELQDPEASYNKHCERNLENIPSLEELLCLKTRSDSPKIRNFIKWFRKHTHVYAHFRAEKNHSMEKVAKNRYT